MALIGSQNQGVALSGSAVRESAVTERLTMLRDQVQTCGKLVTALSERLQPVVSSVPTPSAPKEALPPVGPLAASLTDEATKLASINDELRRLIDCLEL